MSYGGMRNSDGYWRSSNAPTAQNGYNGNGSGQATTSYFYPDPSIYQTANTTSQYNAQAYNWSATGQQSYGVNGGGQGYGSEAWRDNSGQTSVGPQRQYQRDSSNYVANPPSATNAPSGHYKSPTIRTETPTQGLNSLAYASSLESSGLEPTSKPKSNFTYSDGATQYGSNANLTVPAYRTSSPARNTLSQYSRLPPPPSASIPPSASHLNAVQSTRDTASHAAEALAGAVDRRRQISATANSQHVSSSTVNHQHTRQATASPILPPAMASHHRQNSSQGTGNQTNVRSPKAARARPNANAKTIPISSQKTNHQRPPSSAQVSSNLANLVTDNVWPPRNSPTPVEEQTSMPTHIDPSQVFNPFHREHAEKRRREAVAAAAETQRKLEAEKAAEAARSQPAASEPQMAQAEPRQSTAEDIRGPIKASKPPTMDISSQARSPSAQPSSASVGETAASPTDNDIAAELKQMMDKMKALKNKDPSLFLKAWEELRSGTAPDMVKSIAVSAIPPEPYVEQQQAYPPASFMATTTNLSVWDRYRRRKRPAPGVHANGYRVVVENNPDNLPDLGRFPAERRIRSAYGDSEPSYKAGVPHELNGYHVVVQNNPENLPDLGRFPAERRYRKSSKEYELEREIAVASLNASHTGALAATAATSAGPTTAASLPQPVSQPLPPKRRDGTTVWPEAKRHALATTAVRVLTAMPGNETNPITVDDVQTMLIGNPSYIDLCKTFEDRGLKFRRGSFARVLLDTIPDLNNQRPEEGTASAATPSIMTTQATAAPGGALLGRTAPVSHGPTIPGSFLPNGYIAASPQQLPMSALPGQRGVMRLVTDPGGQWSPLYHQAPQGVPPPQIQPSKAKAKPRLPGTTYASRIPPPGTKEALARKRDFSEIVDLTALNDNDDYVMSVKRPRERSPSPETDPIAAYENSVVSAPPEIPPERGGSQAHPGASSYSNIPGHQPFSVPQAPFLHQLSGPQTSTRLLAKQINKSDALRKSYYDAKTVARDILIAAGRHPGERPLNAHLTSLLGYHINLDSDLNTFDWDAIDPGGPKPPEAPWVDIPTVPPRFRLGQRSTPNESQRQKIPEVLSIPAPTTAEDTAKTHPTISPALFSKLSAQTRDLRQVSESTSKDYLQKPSRLREITVPSPPSVRSSRRTSTPRIQRTSNDASPAPNRSSSHLTSPQSLTSDTRKSTATPQPSPMDPPKKRGRPFGAKNRLSYSTQQAPHSHPIPVKKAGFQSYACGWTECDAELHNLATLRTHIKKSHRPKLQEGRNGFGCRWSGCQHQNGRLRTFRTPDELSNHVEVGHVQALGLKYGDGPSTMHIGKHKPILNLSRFIYQSRKDPETRTVSYLDPQTLARDKARYLSDENNRITTLPAVSSITHPDVPKDALVIAKTTKDPDDLAPEKAFMKVHGIRKTDVKKSAEEILRAMEVKKEQIGPGMDRGGCILVTEERAATLIHEADIARVIDFDLE